MNILVVDDKAENQYFLDALLRGNGFRVESASNGAEALKLLENSVFDLIISDILMPVMDGFQLCREIRANDKLRSIPIIIYTATYTAPQDEKLALQIGADSFILKPCEPDVFMETVKELLNTKKSGKDNITHTNNEEKEILNLYNERLVKKLEEKMLQGEKEIEARKKAEKSLALINSRLEMALSSSKTGLWDFNLNTKELWLSREWKELLGYRDDEIPNQYGEWEKLLHPDDRDRVFREMNNYINNTSEKYDIEFRLLHKDGLYRWFVSRGAIISDSKQKRFIGGHIEISEKKIIEEQLKSSLNELKVIYENAPVLLIVFDREMVIRKVNDTTARFTGKSKNSIPGLVCGEGLGCIHYSSAYGTNMICNSCKLRDLIQKTFSDGISRSDEEISISVFNNHDIVNFTLLVSTSYLKTHDYERVLVCLQDISERKRAEDSRRELQEQLYQSQKLELVGLLAGGVAHDFNNILTVILLDTELMINEIGQNNPGSEILEEILQAAQKGADLTRQLLAFSRKQVLDIQTADLNIILGNFKKMISRLLRESIELRFNPLKDQIIVNVDIPQIDQVMMNLAVNARDAMPNGGILTIETLIIEFKTPVVKENYTIQSGTYAVLRISDTGCGMNDEVMKHIFEPFYTTKDIGKGTGLGLSTVYGIIKQHKGYIQISSEPGKGSVFDIFLPLSRNELCSQTEASQTKISAPEVLRILIIEDDPKVLKLSANILSKKGYQVIQVSEAGEALNMAAGDKKPINLVIADVIMPDMNGPDIFNKIAKYHPEAKVLYISGYTNDIIANHGVLKEGIAFMEKPFTEKQLTDKVSVVIQS